MKLTWGLLVNAITIDSRNLIVWVRTLQTSDATINNYTRANEEKTESPIYSSNIHFSNKPMNIDNYLKTSE